MTPSPREASGRSRISLWHSMRALYVGRSKPRWVMALAAYMDDSREEGQLHSIAGYLGVLDDWESYFAPEWNAVLEKAPHPLSEFKASDCRALQGEFNGWTREEADGLTKDLVSVLTHHPSSRLFGFGAVMRIPPMDDLVLLEKSERLAHLMCFSDVVSSILLIAGHRGETDMIHFVHDYQPNLKGRLDDIFAEVRDVWKPTYQGDVSHLQFEDSEKVLPLQAADLLAYETRKDLKNRLESPPRKRSKELEVLMDAHFHIAYYMDAIYLRQYQEMDERGHGDEPAGLPILYASPTLEAVMPWETRRPAPLRWSWST